MLLRQLAVSPLLQLTAVDFVLRSSVLRTQAGPPPWSAFETVGVRLFFCVEGVPRTTVMT